MKVRSQRGSIPSEERAVDAVPLLGDGFLLSGIGVIASAQVVFFDLAEVCTLPIGIVDQTLEKNDRGILIAEHLGLDDVGLGLVGEARRQSWRGWRGAVIDCQ